MSDVRASITIPPWPNHLVVWPSIPLGGMWALAWTLFVGGALGLSARRPRWVFGAVALGVIVIGLGAWLLAAPWQPQHMAMQLASIHESSAQILITAPPPP